MNSDFDWQAPPLSPQEQALVDAYLTIGLSVDELPYTEEFEKLCQLAFGNKERTTLRFAFLTLLRLRKQARLPRTFSAGRVRTGKAQSSD